MCRELEKQSNEAISKANVGLSGWKNIKNWKFYSSPRLTGVHWCGGRAARGFHGRQSSIPSSRWVHLWKIRFSSSLPGFEWGIHHLAGFFFLNLIPSSIRMISNGMYPFPQRFSRSLSLRPQISTMFAIALSRAIRTTVDKKSSVFLSSIPEMEIISIDAFVCFWFICKFSSVLRELRKRK